MVKRIKTAVLASSTKALVVGVMVGALLVATAGFVAAQSSTVINGCIQKQTNLLKIPSSGSCDPKNETAISWNQVGPQGPRGPSNAYVIGPIAKPSLSSEEPTASFTNLPAGKYLISVNMTVGNAVGAPRGAVICFGFLDGNNVIPFRSIDVIEPPPPPLPTMSSR